MGAEWLARTCPSPATTTKKSTDSKSGQAFEERFFVCANATVVQLAKAAADKTDQLSMNANGQSKCTQTYGFNRNELITCNDTFEAHNRKTSASLPVLQTDADGSQTLRSARSLWYKAAAGLLDLHGTC